MRVGITKSAVAGLACVAAANGAHAHDAWIEARRTGDGEVSLAFRIGHAGENEPWTARPDRVSGFVSHGLDGIADLQARLGRADQTVPLLIPFAPDAVHVVTINSFRAFIELEADRFNAYVEEEGITPIAVARAASGSFSLPGTELYSRHLKAIVPAMSGECLPQRVSRPTGQRLEILPVDGTIGPDGEPMLTVEVRYLGIPAEGVTLHVNDIAAGEATATPLTGPDGRAEITLPDTNAWYVHAAWSEKLALAERGADYVTAFASLSILSDGVSNRVCIAPG